MQRVCCMAATRTRFRAIDSLVTAARYKCAQLYLTKLISLVSTVFQNCFLGILRRAASVDEASLAESTSILNKNVRLLFYTFVTYVLS